MKFLHRFRTQFRKKELDQDLSEELAFHIEQETEENIAAGMSVEEAHYAALRKFGGVEQVKEECRDAWGLRFINDLLQDVRFGLRMLAKNPGFTAVAVITLALGIGASTAIFSVVNTVLLRPLPYKDPGRLVWVTVTESISFWGTARVWRPDFVAWREGNKSLEQIAAFQDFHGYNLTGGSEPVRVQAMRVSTDFFALLGVPPIRGRTFLPEESQPGHNQVAVLTHGHWQRNFGSDPSIVGKTIALDGASFTTIGVMPEDFKCPDSGRFDVWLPLPADQSGDRPGNSVNLLRVLGRLKPGVTMENARAELETITRRLDREYPPQMAASHSKQRLKVVPLHEQLVGDARLALFILLGAVSFVLLIACANVANLLLARATTREKEIAIRTTLGAGRVRLIGQLLVESILLAILGGALGLLIATWSVDTLKALVPETIPGDLGIDLRVLAFTLGVSVLTGVVFGLAPTLVATKLNLNETLKEGGMRTTALSGRHRLRSGLVVSELALTLILLVGASLLTRSFLHLLEVNPGFNTHNVLTAQVWLPFTDSVLSNQRRQADFYTQVLERIKSLPGVKSAAATTHAPLTTFDRMDSGLNVEGHAPLEATVSVSAVSPAYFRTMGIRLLKGREFSEQDREGMPSVVIVNESLARLAFPNQDPLGKRIGGTQPPQLTIVGVVSDVKNLDLDKESWPEMYWPYLQRPSPFMTLVIRSDSEPLGLAAAVRNQVLAVDKDQPVFDVQTMEQRLSGSVAPRQFRMLLLGLFAGVALVLAAVGIYGLMAFSVTQRTHEIGIRVALGAEEREILNLVVWQGFRLALIGVGIGVAGAFALTRFIASFLYGVKPTDSVTFGGMSLLLVGVTLLACYIPARRATKVDPMVALRYE